MALMNLLKANYTGKLGQTVGSKWKDKSTLRSFTAPSNPDTPEQQRVRGIFGPMTKFISLFAPQLKSLSPLDTRAMSVRNAIIHLNSGEFTGSAFLPADLKISRGGLPLPSATQWNITAASGAFTLKWDPAAGTQITAKAKVVGVVINQTNQDAVVISALNSAGTLTGALNLPPQGACDCYLYLLDYRGSTKVGSISAYSSVTPA